MAKGGIWLAIHRRHETLRGGREQTFHLGHHSVIPLKRYSESVLSIQPLFANPSWGACPFSFPSPSSGFSSFSVVHTPLSKNIQCLDRSQQFSSLTSPRICSVNFSRNEDRVMLVPLRSDRDSKPSDGGRRSIVETASLSIVPLSFPFPSQNHKKRLTSIIATLNQWHGNFSIVNALISASSSTPSIVSSRQQRPW